MFYYYLLKLLPEYKVQNLKKNEPDNKNIFCRNTLELSFYKIQSILEGGAHTY